MGHWFNFELRLLYVQSFAGSPHVRVGFLWIQQFPPTSEKHASFYVQLYLV